MVTSKKKVHHLVVIENLESSQSHYQPIKNLRFEADEKEKPDYATPTGYGLKKGNTS